jgi:hypothetical protein
VQRLVSHLFDRWAGKPILVIGGGPSVLADLPKLDIVPACVISANDHGFRQTRFPVDLIVNLDKRHCMLQVPMQKVLRPFNVPIVNPHSWADYRLAEWRMAGNSGMAAVAVAAALGASQVIVTGIDMFAGGRKYFHDPGGKVPKENRQKHPSSRRAKARLLPLKEFCAGANIRPMSGPMTEIFPRYKPGAELPEAKDIDYRRRMHRAEILVRAIRSFHLSSFDTVNVDTVMAVTEREIERDSKIPCNTVRTLPEQL